MGYGIALEVSGNYALFTRPELRVERYTYDVITPSAARGILEAIFWKPGLRYVIDSIVVMNEIKTTNIRRNEVNSKISARDVAQVIKGKNEKLYLATSTDIAQRASVVLKDVRYVINAHFELTDKAGESDTKEKFYNMLLRRTEKGQCFYNPYFGTKEFPVSFKLYKQAKDGEFYYYNKGERDLGLMLYDMDYSDQQDIKPMYFRAMMENGVIITDPNKVEVLR